MKARFESPHLLGGKMHARVIDGLEPLHQGVLLAKSKGLGETNDSLARVQQAAIPVLFQYAPHALNRIVLAVIGWIVGQVNRPLKVVSQLGHAEHELSTPTVVFRAVIQINQ